MLLLSLTLVAHAGAFNDWSGPVDLPKNTISITLESVEGDVEIAVDPEATEAVVEAVDFRPGRVCVLEVVKDKKGRSEIHFGAKDLEDPKECRADFTLTLPPAMAVRVELALGDVEVSGLAGEVELQVASGDVRLSDLGGPVEVQLATGDLRLDGVRGALEAEVGQGRLLGKASGAIRASVGQGKIDLEGLEALVKADTGVGDILLTWTRAPTGVLDLNAGNGNVVVDLPDGTAVKARLSSMSGNTRSELPEGGELEVVAVAGMGSVRVH